MRRLLALLTLLLLVAAACGDDGGSTQDADESFDPPSSSTTAPLTRPTDGPAPDIDDLPEGAVVFSPDDVEQDSRGEEVTWTPSVRDVRTAEDAFQSYIDDHPELDVDDVDEYVRQYVGTGQVGENVSVNALCSADENGFDWQDEYIVVDDGGSCFWQAELSFFLADVESFTVNGDA